MFGYIGINPEALDPSARDRYMVYYCGLCHTLKARHGRLSRLTLSYDMTFLLILLSSLYEPIEGQHSARCIPHPVKPRPYVRSDIAEYVADMNIALAYHKGKDDWADEKSAKGLAQIKLLKRAYHRVQAAYPEKCSAIEGCLRRITLMEKARELRIDPPANLTGEILGEIFAYQDDIWKTPLRKMGEELGRFIYLMDAYEDMPGDIENNRYNPLVSLKDRADFEPLCKDALMMSMSECVRAFEVLPLIQNVDILKNVLYGGVWRRYVDISDKRAKEGSA